MKRLSGRTPYLVTAPLLLCLGLLGGCGSDSFTADEGELVTLTMAMPDSLSAVAPVNTTTLLGVASTVEECADYYDNDAAQNWLDNGYDMTAWLVGVSQSQSCLVDVLLRSVISRASTLANTGIQLISDSTTEPAAPTHLRFDKVGEQRELWLYFATPGQNLPAELSGIKVIYLSWSRSGAGNATGKFVLANEANMQGTTSNMRIDFSRGEGFDSNKVYFDMGAEQADGISDFRVDLCAEGLGSATTYSANGLMTLFRQPLPNLPASESFAIPSVNFRAVTNHAGDGMALASVNEVAIQLANDHDGDGIYSEYDTSTGDSDYNFGSYQFTLDDVAYFPSTATSKADIEWRYKTVSAAAYVNSSGTNLREGPDATISWMHTFLEDYSLTDGVVAGYFTDTCSDADGADCQAFIQLLFDNDIFHTGVENSAAPAPEDWRVTALSAITPLTSATPSGEDGTTTYQVPSPF